MRKVALLFGSRIDAPTGASAVMRSFYNNIEYFKNNGIELNIYSPDIFKESDVVLLKKDDYQNLYKKLGKFIKKSASKNSFFAIISILVPYFRSTIVRRYISSNFNDEIVFMHDILSCYKFIKLRKNKDVKIILVLHTNGDTWSMHREYYRTLEKSFFYKYLLLIERKVLGNVERIGFVAEYPSLNFIKLHPEIDKNKIFYVYNGLSLDFNCKKSIIQNKTFEYEICCVGSISERKGQRFIVEALHKMSIYSNIPNVHFSIIGEGSIKEELVKLAEEYSVSKHITFYGSSCNVDEYLASSNIFILPSVSEGLPIAILEAMKADLPIVSTKVGGIPEMIIEKETGIFIEPTTNGVYEFLLNIDKYDWKEMGGRSRQLFIERFSVETMIKSYSSIMKSL